MSKSITGWTDEQRIIQYQAAAASMWDDWRDAVLKCKIVDRDGNVHEMPDPGPFPGKDMSYGSPHS